MTDRTGDKRSAVCGFSLVELMIAMVVLSVGLLGLMGLVAIGISYNSRARYDTSGTLLAQSVLEMITAQTPSQATALTVTDCAGTAHTVATTTGGATVSTSSGDIDWTVAQSSVPANYSMLYDVCTNSGTMRYEVRWNLSSALGGNARLVVVSAKNVGFSVGSSQSATLYALPVSLKAVQGN
jgi:type IV pilus modification protein PilV